MSFDILPKEIQFFLLIDLSPGPLSMLACSSQIFNKMIVELNLWKHRMITDHPEIVVPSETLDHRVFYRQIVSKKIKQHLNVIGEQTRPFTKISAYVNAVSAEGLQVIRLRLAYHMYLYITSDTDGLKLLENTKLRKVINTKYTEYMEIFLLYNYCLPKLP